MTEFFARWREDQYEGDMEAIAQAVAALEGECVSRVEHAAVLDRLQGYIALVTWYSVRDVFVRHLLEATDRLEQFAVMEQLNAWEGQNPKPHLPRLISETEPRKA